MKCNELGMKIKELEERMEEATEALGSEEEEAAPQVESAVEAEAVPEAAAPGMTLEEAKALVAQADKLEEDLAAATEAEDFMKVRERECHPPPATRTRHAARVLARALAGPQCAAPTVAPVLPSSRADRAYAHADRPCGGCELRVHTQESGLRRWIVAFFFHS